MTAQPIRSPTMASTAASHAGTVLEHSGVKGSAVLPIVGAVVVVKLGKLFTLVKIYGCS